MNLSERLDILLESTGQGPRPPLDPVIKNSGKALRKYGWKKDSERSGSTSWFHPTLKGNMYVADKVYHNPENKVKTLGEYISINHEDLEHYLSKLHKK